MKKTFTCALFLFSASVTAEVELSVYERYQQWVDEILLELGADGQFDPTKGIDWSVMPGPFYTPEKQFGIGVSAVGLYRVDLDDTVSQPSSITLNGFGSVNGSVGISLHSATYLQQDQYRLFFDAEFMNAPEIYYGTGIQAGLDNTRIDYEQRSYQITPQGMIKVRPNTFLGMGFEISQYQVLSSSLNAHSFNDRSPQRRQNLAGFPSKRFNAGIILNATYDSRDFALNASEGRLVQLDYYNFNQNLGSDTDFQRIKLNYSDYFSLTQFSGVIAWQGLIESNYGDVSWDQMAKLGGGKALRGYEQGHYRDKNMVLSQVEYRQPLGGRHGMVYWLGAGTLADQVQDLGRDEWLYSVGVGYRFEIKQRVNLRLDYGFGKDQSGFYFAINEAF